MSEEVLRCQRNRGMEAEGRGVTSDQQSPPVAIVTPWLCFMDSQKEQVKQLCKYIRADMTVLLLNV